MTRSVRHAPARPRRRGVLALLLGATTAFGEAVQPLAPIPVSMRPLEGGSWSARSDMELGLPGEVNVSFHLAAGDWTDASSMTFGVAIPADGPTNLQTLVFVSDWDHLWYQTLLPGFLQPGRTNELYVDFSVRAGENWTAHGHFSSWHHRALQKPKLVGMRVFGKDEAPATRVAVSDALAVPRRDNAPPTIRGVRPNALAVPCHEKFELSFSVPDRYADPFDADTVAVDAEFVTPGGEKIRVDGFHTRDYFRRIDHTGEHLVPQGPPYWQVRFAPLAVGVHTYTLRVRDRMGSATWGPGVFTATAPRSPGFLRVSRTDPRYLEFGNGTFFFPIGHNIRSPNDTRMDANFPWSHRWEEGSSSYLRRFTDMSANGENFAEVWTAAWSLGLEWNADWQGYRGVGQYNLMNAWELDRVMDAAAMQSIYIGLVLLNHGKFSAFSDAEWNSNPFNTDNGGYLSRPDDYFTDPRAIASFRKLMRYMIARWGYSTQLATWQLWSELDLTGMTGGSWRRPEVVDWHRLMAHEIKEMDPYDHMVVTHVCGDYTHQDPQLIELPQLDYCAVDAYHGNPDALHIVDLMRRTVAYNNPFGKPVLITEFGGTPMGHRLKHLTDSLHAAIWSATALPMAGTPLFWWWHIIEEEDLYPMFAAVSRYMQDEDRRDPTSLVAAATLTLENGYPFAGDVACMSNGETSHGWLFHTAQWDAVDPLGPPVTKSVVLRIPNVRPGRYEAEFWDTQAGTPFAQVSAECKEGTLQIGVPPFARDIAFKVRPAIQ